jgi:hypothetical protein
MDDYTPEPEDEQPSDDESTDEYRRAAEATLQRLMRFLHAFSAHVPPQTTPTDIDDPHLAPGALYSIPGSMPHTFQVIKVLAVDEFGVHVCLYGNSFERRPATVAPDLLDTSPFISMAPEDVGQEWPLSVGHLPLQAATFVGMRPVFIAQEDVTPEEMEEYNDWQHSDGGYL